MLNLFVSKLYPNDAEQIYFEIFTSIFRKKNERSTTLIVNVFKKSKKYSRSHFLYYLDDIVNFYKNS